MFFPPHVEPSPAAGSRRGFTLVELMIALALAGVIAAAVYRVALMTARLVELQAAREEVQQNLRGTLDLIAGDLRGVLPAGILSMHHDSIRFYLPRAWGVSCAPVDSANDTLWAVVPSGLLRGSGEVFARAHWGVGLRRNSDAPGAAAGWKFVPAPGRATGAGPCAGVEPPTAPPRHALMGFVAPSPGSFADSAAVGAGATVLIFEEIKYDVTPGPSGVVPGRWVRRMVGRNATGPNMQPLAGPVAPRNGLRFAYYTANGSPARSGRDVRRVEITMVVESRQRAGSDSIRTPLHVDSATVQVTLRNAW
jgi:prepilin-type N-terminal cleavage/methylation domain-containing protein